MYKKYFSDPNFRVGTKLSASTELTSAVRTSLVPDSKSVYKKQPLKWNPRDIYSDGKSPPTGIYYPPCLIYSYFGAYYNFALGNVFQESPSLPRSI